MTSYQQKSLFYTVPLDTITLTYQPRVPINNGIKLIGSIKYYKGVRYPKIDAFLHSS